MTDTALDRLQTELAALAAVWSDAAVAAGSVAAGWVAAGPDAAGSVAAGSVAAGSVGDEGDAFTPAEHRARADRVAGGSFDELSDAGLVRVVEQAGRVRRTVDAFLARAGDEIAKRSVPGFGAEGLAKRHGFASPVKLVAAATGGAPAEAARLVAVGEATRERESFAGEVRPARFASVRAALDRGTMSLEAANLITGMLGRVEVRTDAALLDQTEAGLTEIATRQPWSVLSRAVKLAEARLDPGRVATADEELAQERSLSFREDANGVFHLRARLDPVTAAPVKAALDAMVSEALRRRIDGVAAGAHPTDQTIAGSTGRPGASADDPPVEPAAPVGATGPVVEDRRSIPQLQADALAELARHVLGCTTAPGVLPRTTVIVRMDLQALLDGLGTAEIDGIDRPIAAGTARRLAADAELIPAVLGTDSVPLDLGRSARLFTRAQRLALAERDGGCASCGANITFADAHHIDWWTRDAGPTDLANGVMLCSHCHHQVHDHGWEIRIREGLVWFIPPPHLDPDRTPRLGGRARFDPARACPQQPAA